ncbi:MAG: peptide deformylase [Actinobacteria bacterium]|nr:MAG: peptide deformylase [Actinomycetota bacterium]
MPLPAQTRFVVVDRDLDRAQPPHPRERAAERSERRVRAGPEVPQPPADRLAGHRAVQEVGLERLAFRAVPRCLGPRNALAHDRLPLSPIHAASVPVVTEVEGQVRVEPIDAEREARRQLALAQIRQYPDPVLRMQAKPVVEFDEDLRRLVERMSALMIEARGVGLAATQVGILRRVFVFSPEDDEVATLVNPVITARSDEVELDDEGCLSLQGVLVPVERAVTVRIEGKDEQGNDVAYDLEGYAARTVQHELDHLDGALMIDRTTPEARREALGTLRPRVVIG